MLISIIIPTCGRMDMLQRALLSLQQQSFQDFNVIIVDDSKDSCFDLTAFEIGKLDVTLIKNIGLHGVSRARNLGIESAKGQWIFFLDDDDALCNDYLKLLQKNIESNPLTELFWCGVMVNLNPALYKKAQKELLLYKEDDIFYIGASYGVAIKRSILAQHGHFDNELVVAEDTELFLRLLSNGIIVKPIQTIGIVKDETHSNRLSSGYKIYSEKKIYEKLFLTYHELLAKHKRNYCVLLCWSIYVHFINRNYRLAASNIKKLFNVLVYIRASTSHARIMEKAE